MNKDNIISVQKNRGRSSNTLQVKILGGSEFSVPMDTGNRHYRAVLEWLDDGNVILDPPPKNVPDDHPGTAYSEHPIFTLPDDNETIWRYMRVEQFISMLMTKSLWFVRGNILRNIDPYEGQLPNPNLSISAEELISSLFGGIELKSDEIKRAVESHRDIQDLIRFNTLVNCWNKFNYESRAMWKVYGKGKNCIAVKSDVGSLKKSFGVYSDYSVYIGEIQYIDYEKEEISESNYFNLFLHKTPYYKDEHEIRCIIADDGDTELFDKNEPYLWNVQENVELSPGTKVNIDFKTLVKEVIVGPESDSWFKDIVENLLLDYKLADIPVNKSVLRK